MIGQKDIVAYVTHTKAEDFPHFSIIIGEPGSGKKTVARFIADKLGAIYSPCGIKVADIREMIDTAQVMAQRVVFCIEDADLMRNEAKNALLKITEEPPENAYFIMTVCNDSTLLDTLVSRANMIPLDAYTIPELREYWDMKYSVEYDDFADRVVNTATTPYEVDLLMHYGQEFIDYVDLVIDNIAEVEPANAFKSSCKLSLKSGQEGYDLKCFWITFVNRCVDRILEDTSRYSLGIIATLPYIYNISTRVGMNLQQAYDLWVFDIRRAWM